MGLTALLLAAGEGLRLGAATQKCPKPMLEIGGRPILEHNVRLLVRHGITELIINLHHSPEVIERHLGDGAALGAHITYSREPVLLGTAGAAKRVAPMLSGTFLVIYADNLTTCDLTRLITFHREKGGVGTVALFYRENATASGIAEFDANDRITRFVEKPTSGHIFSPWVNAGILVFEESVLDDIPDGRSSDFGREILPSMIASGQALYGYRMTEDLWWIDSPEDLERTQREVREGRLSLP